MQKIWHALSTVIPKVGDWGVEESKAKGKVGAFVSLVLEVQCKWGNERKTRAGT